MTERRATAALGALVLVAIVATTVWSFVAARHDARRMPSPEEIAVGNAAALAVANDLTAYRPYPEWFADARVGLDGLPILMGRPIDPWELPRYERIVQLVSRSHLDEADDELGALGVSETELIHESERYLVRAVTLPTPSAAVAWDGFEALQDAVVTQRAANDSVTPCALWTRDAWHCGRPNEYIYVGRSLRELGDQNPHRCIMANPPEGGASWVVHWSGVPAAGRTLRWRAGNEYMAIRSDRGAPVSVSVFVDGERVHQRAFDIHDESFDVVEVPLPAAETANVTFELRADDHFDRFFCFHPQVVD